MPKSLLLLFALLIQIQIQIQVLCLFALLPTARASCFGTSNKSGNYVLDWRAEGTSFFDDENFEFDLDDYNNGASQYVNRSTALDEKLVQAHGSHAVVRVGAVNKTATTYQRKTVKLDVLPDSDAVHAGAEPVRHLARLLDARGG